MSYRLPLKHRERLARNKREQYWRDPEYRLEQINAVRRRRGLPPYMAIEHVPHRGPLA